MISALTSDIHVWRLKAALTHSGIFMKNAHLTSHIQVQLFF